VRVLEAGRGCFRERLGEGFLKMRRWATKNNVLSAEFLFQFTN